MPSNGNNDSDYVSSSSLLPSSPTTIRAATISGSINTGTRRVVVPWTVADLFREPPKLAVFYHSVGTSFDLAAPAGAALGALLWFTLFHHNKTDTPFVRVVANGALVVGCIGMLLGAVKFAWEDYTKTTSSPSSAPSWDAAGLYDRRERLSRNVVVRNLDAGVYTGLSVGIIATVVAGGPESLGLSTRSTTLGLLQAMGLGSAAGSLMTLAWLGLTNSNNSGR